MSGDPTTWFDGQVAVVTGAVGGLGRALCWDLAQRGATVVALDLDQGALDQLETDAKAQSLAIWGEVCDVTDNEACAAVAIKTVNRFGDPHILINNAGITHFSRFADTSAETIAKVMAVNFMGAVHVTKAFLSAIVATRGTIVAVSSVAGFSPLFGRTGYAASKHALHGFFDSLRSELRESRVNVMMVCPSFIATQADHRTGEADTDVARPGSATQTAGKPMTPEQVSRAICHGIAARRRQLVIGRLGKAAFWVNKFFPRLFERAMTAKIRAEFAPKTSPSDRRD